MEPRSFRYYFGIVAFFLTLYLAAAYGWQALGRSLAAMPTAAILLLVLATYRLARIMTRDEVTQPFRFPFVRIRRHHGEEEEVPRAGGLSHALGQLVTCSGCTGVWVAALLSYAYALWPQWAALFLLVFGVAGGAHLLDVLANALKRPGREEG